MAFAKNTRGKLNFMFKGSRVTLEFILIEKIFRQINSFVISL